MQSEARTSIARVAALALGFSGLAGRSEAAVIQYTYVGTVGYGYDRAGIFGSAEVLTGQAFTLIERFDTLRNAYRWVDSAQSLQFGGSTRGVPDSASLAVTIGGATRRIADLEDYIYSGSDTGKHLDFVKDVSGYEYAGFYVESALIRADYGTPYRLDADQARFFGNYQFFDASNAQRATYASFDVQSLTIGPVSAVPLPESLALLGTSLIALGTGAQIRRVMARRFHDRMRTWPKKSEVHQHNSPDDRLTEGCQIFCSAAMGAARRFGQPVFEAKGSTGTSVSAAYLVRGDARGPRFRDRLRLSILDAALLANYAAQWIATAGAEL